jgi:hypothetical protein
MTMARSRITAVALAVGALVALGVGLLLLDARPEQTPAAGFLGSEFMFASELEPDLLLPSSGAPSAYRRADAAFVALGAEGYLERSVTVVASFETDVAAATAGAQVDTPDATALVLGRILVVTGLPADAGEEPIPLVAELGALGADVLVEGDRYGEGAIVVDMTCDAPTAEVATSLAASLGDFASAPGLGRPPWVHPPLTESEELARATYRRWVETYRSSALDSDWMAEYGRRLLAATSDGEREELIAELRQRVVEERPAGLDHDVHPGVWALLVAAPTGNDAEESAAWRRELASLMGALPAEADHPTWYERRHAALIGSVQATGTRLKLGWVTFYRFALGMTGLVAHLDASGCANVHVRLHDFDDIRGD